MKFKLYRTVVEFRDSGEEYVPYKSTEFWNRIFTDLTAEFVKTTNSRDSLFNWLSDEYGILYSGKDSTVTITEEQLAYLIQRFMK